MEGKLVIFSAPSGAGKTTIVRDLLERGLNLSFSVSATTRPPRGKEKDGIDYFFLTVPEFKRRIGNNEFVEWEEVYTDLFYGTLRSEVERIRAVGNHVLFDVDVKGGIRLKQIYGEKALAIFVMPPSVDELKNRLISRGTDSMEKIRIRVEKAHQELLMADQFDEIIVNESLKKATEDAFRVVSRFLVHSR
jgi:guanylate kinase